MASGSGSDQNQLLPSDVRAVQQVTQYAFESSGRLNGMSTAVRNMGRFQLFMDSKVPRCESCPFSVSLRFTDPREITGEIEKYLDLYKSMIDVADKIEHENEAELGEGISYDIMIKLNDKLAHMFELAQSGMETTSSKAISKLYKEFLENKSKLENKIKQMECVFLKQQFLRENERLHAKNRQVVVNTVDAIAYKEKMYNEMVEEANYLKKQNKELQELIGRASEKLDYCEKHANLLKEKKLSKLPDEN